MTTVDQLSTGQVLLTSLKAVNGNKIQMEIAEIVNERPISAASLFNIGDDRFSNKETVVHGKQVNQLKLLNY